MEALLIRERYKVVRVMCIRPGYALLEAVDIAERETPSRLLNLYEGELLHRYARICAGIKKEDCPAFREMFLESGTLVVVFDNCAGVDIDRHFYRGDDWKWKERLFFAELVLHQALSLANLPPEISCAAMLSENIMIDLTNEKVNLRYKVLPMDDMNARELTLMASDQIKKILPRSLRAGAAEQRFLDCLDAGTFRSIVPLYACWREAEPEIRAEREEFEGRNVIRQGLTLLVRALRRLVGRGGRS